MDELTDTQRATMPTLRINVPPAPPIVNPTVSDLVKVSLTTNQAAGLTMYANSIGMAAFEVSPVLAAINAGDPNLAMAYLMEDVFVRGRYSVVTFNERLAAKNLFQN